MSKSSSLMEDVTIGGITLPNRLAVSPMCQYSAENGVAQDWHLAHLGYLSTCGAGLLMFEATAVLPAGRITPHCLGLYSEECESALEKVVALCRSVGSGKLGLQIGHAGRKGASQVPWEGGKSLPENAWPLLGPSEIALSENHVVPVAATKSDLEEVVTAFRTSALRARSLGFDVLELHAAHGYLLNSFFSPLSNTRSDEYGGSRAARMRLPMDVFAAVREIWPEDRALGVRISGTDWKDGGADVEDAVAFALALEAAGCDYVTVSSGGIATDAKIPVGPGYQVPLASAVRQAVKIAVGAVGMIAPADYAAQVVRDGDADLIFVGRGFLSDPHLAWRVPGATPDQLSVPPQYLMASPDRWQNPFHPEKSR